MLETINLRGTTTYLVKANRPGAGAHVGRKKDLKAEQNVPPMTFDLEKGPFQNNGATPWYCNMPVGSDDQRMKVALDTGSNFIWLTSTLCGPDGCAHYGKGQFNPNSSTSFQWLDQSQKNVSFGPWGTMVVELGEDNFKMKGADQSSSARSPFYLAASYDSTQFFELDWDGGIGFPSGSAYADPDIPPMFAKLLNQGMLDPQMPYISFCTDGETKTGKAILGGYEENDFDLQSGVFMPWTPYTEFSGVEYIWTSPLSQLWVGDELIATNKMFSLDSGSSQFKGDDTIMNTIYNMVDVANPQEVKLVVGTTADGQQGRIIVPPSVYDVKIEAGADKGKTIPQFQPLGLTNLVLVGSVLMDQLYTIFEYAIGETENGYQLSPVGMWLFNKKNGPQLIQHEPSNKTVLGKKQVKSN